MTFGYALNKLLAKPPGRSIYSSKTSDFFLVWHISSNVHLYILAPVENILVNVKESDRSLKSQGRLVSAENQNPTARGHHEPMVQIKN